MHSGDSLTVERESDQKTVRVFLSSVKAPTLNNRPREESKGAQQNESDPYAWESKESLRKLAVGKKVRVEMEYDRVVATRTGGELSMNFAAVLELQKNRNLAAL